MSLMGVAGPLLILEEVVAPLSIVKAETVVVVGVADEQLVAEDEPPEASGASDMGPAVTIVSLVDDS